MSEFMLSEMVLESLGAKRDGPGVLWKTGTWRDVD